MQDHGGSYYGFKTTHKFGIDLLKPIQISFKDMV